MEIELIINKTYHRRFLAAAVGFFTGQMILYKIRYERTHVLDFVNFFGLHLIRKALGRKKFLKLKLEELVKEEEQVIAYHH